MPQLTINIMSNRPDSLRDMLHYNKPVFCDHLVVLNVNGDQSFEEFKNPIDYPNIIHIEHHDWISHDGAANIMANRLSYINPDTPYIMFLDDDTLLNHCLNLGDLTKAFSDPHVGLITLNTDKYLPTRDRVVPLWRSQLLRTVNSDSVINSTGQIYRTEDILTIKPIVEGYLGPAEDQLLARSPQYFCDRPTILKTKDPVGALHYVACKVRCDEVAIIEPQLRELGIHFYRTSRGFHRIVAPWVCSKWGQKHPKNPRVNIYTPFDWSDTELIGRWSLENPKPKEV